MSHLKRTMMPKFWPVRRKGFKYATHTSPGPHPLMESMPLRVLVRDALKYANTAREADKVIKSGAVTVDGKQRKDPKFPVGLMDGIELGDKAYRLSPDANGYSLMEIKKADLSKKSCKIVGKSTVRKGLTQLNLHDGRNILIKTGTYKTGDTVVIEVPSQKIVEHVKFKEGENVIIIDGKSRGSVGKITEIKDKKTMTEIASIVIDVKGESVMTLKNYVMVGNFSEPPIFASRAKKLKHVKAEAVKKEIIKSEAVKKEIIKSEAVKKEIIKPLKDEATKTEKKPRAKKEVKK